MLRLQHENQQLKMQTTTGEDSVLLRSLLDDANVHKHELECQVRQVNRCLTKIFLLCLIFKSDCCINLIRCLNFMNSFSLGQQCCLRSV
jgi:hypothetical protein